jgi:hypothetical protein
LRPRFSIQLYEDGANKDHFRASVKDCEVTVHELGEWRRRDDERHDALYDAGKRWLAEHYPHWEDRLAYWD